MKVKLLTIAFGWLSAAMQHILCNSYGTKNHRTRPWLVVDFDGTCTLKDTTSFLPKIAAYGDKDGGDARMERWKDVENEYLQEYSIIKERLLQQNSSSTIMSLEEALEELDTVSVLLYH